MVKNQHFVPQFYLKYFTSNKERDKIWTYDKPSKKSFETSIKNVACQKGFYDSKWIDNIYLQEQTLENTYADFESFFAPQYLSFLDSLNHKTFYLSESMKQMFATYLMVQITRTQEHRIVLEQMNTEINKQLINKGFSTEDKRKLGLNIDELDSKQIHLKNILSFNFHQSGVNILLNHMWLIYHNITNIPFYTSDNPVNYCSSLSVESFGLASKGIEISFPLSPEYMLVICDRIYFSDLKFLENKTHQLNRQTLLLFITHYVWCLHIDKFFHLFRNSL